MSRNLGRIAVLGALTLGFACSDARPPDCFEVREELMARFAAAILEVEGPLFEGRELTLRNWSEGEISYKSYVVEEISEDMVTLSGLSRPIRLEGFAVQDFDETTGWSCRADFVRNDNWVEYRSQRSGDENFLSGMIIEAPYTYTSSVTGRPVTVEADTTRF